MNAREAKKIADNANRECKKEVLSYYKTVITAIEDDIKLSSSHGLYYTFFQDIIEHLRFNNQIRLQGIGFQFLYKLIIRYFTHRGYSVENDIINWGGK
jgi:hypothetical protein